MRYIYSTAGDWVALVDEGVRCLYDTTGDLIGWLEGKEVYTRDGVYAGFVSGDGRVLRERIRKQRPMRSAPAAAPIKVRPPASAPLAPLFAELPWGQVDVFEEEPEVFRYISDLRPDWND